jgi:curli production assembly/transport component CsgG
LGLAACLALGGCGLQQTSVIPHFNAPAAVAQVTPGQRDLIYIPPPPQPIAVAVYGFADQTGQLRPAENLQSLSRAVTQGGTSILVGALRNAGNGSWFTVVERERLDNLLRERQIIREMRAQYLGEQQTPASILPSLLFAGITLEGGIIGFDTNTQTGGVGARFLGIGGSTQYRTNKVTVYLRAVSVRTGEVLANVVTEKTVSSVQISAGAFRFVTFNELLEAEVGVTQNEPMQLAVQSAIERAVYALILEGATPGPRQLWSFADAAAGASWLERYAQERQRAMAAAYRDAGPLPATTVPAPAPAPAASEPQ